MTQRFARLAVAACLAVASFLPLDQASAEPLTLRLTDGTTTVTVTDGMPGDLNPTVGAVTFIGPLGVFTLNVTTGISYPNLGSQVSPFLELASVDVAGAVGTLTISLSHTDFLTTGPVTFRAQAGGVISPSTATIAYNTWLGADNELFTLGTLLTDLDFVGSPFSGSESAIVETTAPYSLTQVLTMSFSAGGTLVSMNATLQMPEPATLALLGLAFAGLGFSGGLRRRQRKPEV